MSGLTSHVLDLAGGRPASQVLIRLYRRQGEAVSLIAEQRTDADGRARLAEALQVGGYRLTFDVGAYYRAQGSAAGDPPFLDVVPVDFAVADPLAHHHVPLLVSPFGYSTYRGS